MSVPFFAERMQGPERDIKNESLSREREKKKEIFSVARVEKHYSAWIR